MPLTMVKPAYIGYGDTVRIAGHEYLVQSIEFDGVSCYDIYVIDRAGQPHHKVISEPIELEM